MGSDSEGGRWGDDVPEAGRRANGKDLKEKQTDKQEGRVRGVRGAGEEGERDPKHDSGSKDAPKDDGYLEEEGEEEEEEEEEEEGKEGEKGDKGKENRRKRSELRKERKRKRRLEEGHVDESEMRRRRERLKRKRDREMSDSDSDSESEGERRRREKRKRRVMKNKRRKSDNGNSSGSGSDESSTESSTESETDEKKERRRRKEREERRRDRDRERRVREKKRRKKEAKRREKREKRKVGKEGRGRGGAVKADDWGKHGIIRELDMWNKRPEFSAWLAEVKKVNLETLTNSEEKSMFKDFMEDHNTSSFPSKKYYNLAAYEQRQLMKAHARGMKEKSKGKKEMTEFNDEEQRKEEIRQAREQQKEEEVRALRQAMQASGMAQEMREQAKLREEMRIMYQLGNYDAAAAIQKRLEPEK